MSIKFKFAKAPILKYREGLYSEPVPNLASTSINSNIPQANTQNQPIIEEKKALRFKTPKINLWSLLIPLLIIGLAGYAIYRYATYLPLNVNVTNVTSGSATISWVTKEKTPGYVISQKTPFLTPFRFSNYFATVDYDDRDVSVAELEAAQKAAEKVANNQSSDVSANEVEQEVKVEKVGNYYAHHVTVKNLDPETDYYFMVGDGFNFFTKKSENTASVSFKTKKEPENLIQPNPAYGKVEIWGVGKQYLTDGLAYIKATNPDGNKVSSEISSVISENGSWYVDLSNLKNADGTDYIAQFNSTDKDQLALDLRIEGVKYGKYRKLIPLFQDAPADTITIGDPTNSESDPGLKYDGNTVAQKHISSLIGTVYAFDCSENPTKPCSTCKGGNTYPSCELGETSGPNGEGPWTGYMQYCAQRNCPPPSTEPPKTSTGATCECGCDPANPQATACKVSGTKCQDHKCVKDDKPPQETNGSGSTSGGGFCSGCSPNGDGWIYSCDASTGRWKQYKQFTPANKQQLITQCLKETTGGSGSSGSSNQDKCTNPKCTTSQTCVFETQGANTGKYVCKDKSQVKEKVCCYSKNGNAYSFVEGTSCPSMLEPGDKCKEEATPTTPTPVETAPIVELDGCNKDKVGKDCHNSTANKDGKCVYEFKSTDLKNYYYCQASADPGAPATPPQDPNVCAPEQIKICKDRAEQNNVEYTSCKPKTVVVNVGVIFNFNAEAAGFGCGFKEKDGSNSITDYENAIAYVKLYNYTDTCDQSNCLCPDNSSVTKGNHCTIGAEGCTSKDAGKPCKAADGSIGTCPGVAAPGTFRCQPKQASLNEPFKNLVSSVQAQESIILSPSNEYYSIEKPGVYCTEYKNEKYCFKAKNAGEYNIFIDSNGNGKFDDGDVNWGKDAVKINVTKETSTETLEIKKGFNLVSFDVISEDYGMNAANFLDKLNSNYNDNFYSLAKFEAGRWVVVGNRNGEPYGAEQFNIVPGKGYLLKAKEDMEISIDGKEVIDPVPVSLNTGWNLISIHGTDKTYTAESLIDSIDKVKGVDADNATKYDTSKARYEGLQKEADEKGVMQVYGNDFQLYTPLGYFVRLKSGNGVWTPDKK